MKRAFLAALLLGAACKHEQPGEGTPYPACEGVENGQPCGDDGFCADLDGATICNPRCKDNTDCPAFGGAKVECVFSAYCALTCTAPADCPDGMVCEATNQCAWPKG